MHQHYSFDSRPDDNKPPTPTSSKPARMENRNGPVSVTSAPHFGDTSFVSVVTTESDLSQLLNESSVERHLSDGQLELHADTPTRGTTWWQNRMENTWPQLTGKDSNTGATMHDQSLSSATSDFTTKNERRPVSSSPPERLKLTKKDSNCSGGSDSTKECCAHDSRRTEPLSNSPLSLSVQMNRTSDSKQTPSSTNPERDGGRGSKTDTRGDSPLSLDLDHLALQVRDKLSSIFDYSPTLPTEVS